MGDFTEEQLGELVSWRSFYEDHKVGFCERMVEQSNCVGVQLVSWRRVYEDHKVGHVVGHAERGGGCRSCHLLMSPLPAQQLIRDSTERWLSMAVPTASPKLRTPTQEYKLVGRVVGRFYDAAGQPTALLARVEAAAATAAAAKEAAEGKGQAGGGQQVQPCNVKWSKSEGVVGGWAGGGWQSRCGECPYL